VTKAVRLGDVNHGKPQYPPGGVFPKTGSSPAAAAVA